MDGDVSGAAWELLFSVPMFKVFRSLKLVKAESSLLKALRVHKIELGASGKAIRTEFGKVVNYKELRAATSQLITSIKESKQLLMPIARAASPHMLMVTGKASQITNAVLRQKRERSKEIKQEQEEQDLRKIEHQKRLFQVCADRLAQGVDENLTRCIMTLEKIQKDNDTLYESLKRDYEMKAGKKLSLKRNVKKNQVSGKAKRVAVPGQPARAKMR